MLPPDPLEPAVQPRFADPTPLGLLGLAIGCGALVPIALGMRLTPSGLETAAVFCLLFGAGCQLLAGVLNLANHNVYGGTLFTAFAFNWLLNAWMLHTMAGGGDTTPDHGILLATDIVCLVIFVAFTYGFGFFSKVLFLFLLDIDLLYLARVLNGVFETRAFALPIAVLTVLLAALALWIAFVLLINPAAGRAVLPTTGPMYAATPPPSFDFALRQALFAALYGHWRAQAFAPLPVGELQEAMGDGASHDLEPDLAYLEERGGVCLTRADGAITAARLTAAGIDLYERRFLHKTAAV